MVDTPATPPVPTATPRTVANPAQQQGGIQMGAVLMTIVQGLHEIAEAEGSVPQPSGKAWGALRKQLDIILDELGLKVAPAPTAATRMKLPGMPQQTANRMQMRTPYAPRAARVAPTRPQAK